MRILLLFHAWPDRSRFKLVCHRVLIQVPDNFNFKSCVRFNKVSHREGFSHISIK